MLLLKTVVEKRKLRWESNHSQQRTSFYFTAKESSERGNTTSS